ncbi:hypothetical protein Adt_33053 [Abeliophyllum distichum]|uniref:Uncharacterized protein n=1 Tax=Abeliophyllum distichum TaxID=126358 RepID=A0ABD1QV48_9LAMI
MLTIHWLNQLQKKSQLGKCNEFYHLSNLHRILCGSKLLFSGPSSRSVHPPSLPELRNSFPSLVKATERTIPFNFRIPMSSFVFVETNKIYPSYFIAKKSNDTRNRRNLKAFQALACRKEMHSKKETSLRHESSTRLSGCCQPLVQLIS